MVEKIYISANQFLLDSIKLAKKIYDSGFRPTFLIGLWRGGGPPAIAIEEFFRFKGIKMNNYPIKAVVYSGINKLNEKVKISGLGYLISHINKEDKLLIIDDVIDSGKTIKAFMESIKKKARKNTPKEIKIATVFYKPTKTTTNIKPDYYIHETDEWIIFPHELEGLSEEEIKQKDKEIHKIIFKK